MPIFGISGKSLTRMNLVTFTSEKEMQTITEQNLQLIFGIKFVCSEFSVGHFRLDTVGFDDDLSSFVIFEYKNDQNFSVIDQGYAYLSAMFNNKADFVLKYNEHAASSSKKEDFDWSRSKVIFISPSFTPYQIEAISFRDLPIELWKVRLYSNNSNNIIGYNKISSQRASANLGKITKASKVIKNVNSQFKAFSDDALLNGVEPDIRAAYMLIKQIVYQINPNVEEKIKKSMICFYAGGKGLIWIRPDRRKIAIWLRKGNYKDRNGNIIRNGWGDYPELYLTAEDIDSTFIRKIVEQANNI
ncbi:MAG: DUF1801 domain-containing protein [Desulfobacteraceae bacterium]|nr:MAG: DUF1801 domain-containing protein [Desulfobacteraceae bacterium]